MITVWYYLFSFLSSSAPEMLDPKANMKREHFTWASKIPQAPVLVDSSSVQSYAKIQEKQNSSCINKSASDHRYQMCVHQALLHTCQSLCCSFFCLAVLYGMFLICNLCCSTFWLAVLCHWKFFMQSISLLFPSTMLIFKSLLCPG